MDASDVEDANDMEDVEDICKRTWSELHGAMQLRIFQSNDSSSNIKLDRTAEANKRARLRRLMRAVLITQGQIIKGMANPFNTRPDWAMVFGIVFTVVFGSTIVFVQHGLCLADGLSVGRLS